MIGLDTNVLVRYLAQDDPHQSPLATKLIESLTRTNPGFISHVVLVETAWVLESCYAADATKIAEVIETLIRTEALIVSQAEIVWRALREFKREMGDFSDALITQLARQAGCTTIQTFDRGAAKQSGMTLLA